MIRVLVSVALLAIAAPAFAQHAMMTAPSDWQGGPVALAVISLDTGSDRAGDGYYCPPAEDEGADPAEYICMGANFIYHPGRILRIVAATHDFPRPFPDRVFKRIGGHAVIRMSGGYYLAMIEATNDGYGWVPWLRQSRKGGEACVTPDIVKAWSVEPLRDARVDAEGSICLRI